MAISQKRRTSLSRQQRAIKLFLERLESRELLDGYGVADGNLPVPEVPYSAIVPPGAGASRVAISEMVASASVIYDHVALPTPTAGWVSWLGQLGTDLDDHGRAAAVDRRDGSVFLAGTLQAGRTAQSDADPVLAKYSPSGELLWSHRFAALDEQRAEAVAVDSQGSVYLAGVFRGTVDFNPGSGQAIRQSAGTFDIFVVKLSAGGDFLRVDTYGQAGGKWDYISAMTVDGEDNLLLTGFFSATVDFDPSQTASRLLTAHGGNELFLLKLSPNGNLIFARAFGGPASTDPSYDFEDSSGVAVAPDGTIFAGGYVVGPAELDREVSYPDNRDILNSRGVRDAFIAAYGADGKYLWGRSLGATGTSFEKIEDIAVDSSGNPYVIGLFQGSDFDPGGGSRVATQGWFDVVIAKYNGRTGELLWWKTVGSTGDDRGLAIAVDDHHVSAAGYFNLTVNFNPPSAGSAAVLTSRGPAIGNAGDGYMLILDHDGTFHSVHQYGGPGRDLIEDLVVHGRRVYLAGSFEGTSQFDVGSGAISATSGGGQDMALIAFDVAGGGGGQIGGLKWHDRNGDGRINSGEEPLAGWDIYADVNRNGRLDAAEPHARTGADGRYVLGGLDPGNYLVREVPQAGWKQTFPNTLAFSGPATYNGGDFSLHVATGDLNGDGYLDMVTADFFRGSISLFAGREGGTFANPLTVPVGARVGHVAVVDLNRDGHLDIVALDQRTELPTSQPGRLVTFLNDGSGGFAPGATVSVGARPAASVAGDFNGDSRVDLAVANVDSGTVTIALGIGNGTFAPPIQISCGSDPRWITAGDFDRDGLMDLAVTRIWSNMVAVLPGQGDGSFGPPSNFAVAPHPLAVVAADLNGDGFPDLASSSIDSNAISVLINHSGETFEPFVQVPVGSRPHNVGSGDVDGDSDIDLVSANQNSSDVTILLNDGAGRFIAAGQLPSGGAPQHVALDDFDGDGATDIAIAINSAGVAVFHNQLGTHMVTLADDQSVADINFGNHSVAAAAGEIQGLKWNDLDGDGAYEPHIGESALAGWTIYLDLNHNGQLDSGEPSTVTRADDPATSANETGTYRFRGLVPGTYNVAEVLQSGWEQTFPAAPRAVQTGTMIAPSGAAAQLGDVQKLILASDPNGVPPDSPSRRIDPNTKDSLWAGVGSLQIQSTGLCTGTLISAQHVLSAAHCFDPDDNGIPDVAVNNVQFHLNYGSNLSHTFQVSAIDVHPDYTGFNNPSLNDDIAIVTLATAVPAGVPIYPIHRAALAAGNQLTLVGYGRTGNGLSGYQAGTASYDIKRGGSNVADQFEVDDEGSSISEIVTWDFDGPAGNGQLGGPTLGNTVETQVAPGDSGGPGFIVQNGVPEVATVNTFVGVFKSLPTATNGRFGSAGGGALIAAYADWINSIVNPGQQAGTHTVSVGAGQVVSGINFGNRQVVSAQQQIVSGPAMVTAPAGQPFRVPVQYTTSTGDNSLTGLGLRMHWDSSVVTYQQLSSVLPTNLVTQQGPLSDTSDLDGDPRTDKYMLVAWADPTTGGQWPNQSLPAELLVGNFSFAEGLAAGSTTSINFSAASTAADYGFRGTSVTAQVGSAVNLDVDGNGVSDALTDGVLVMRYLFGFTGDTLTAGALASGATRRDPGAIVQYLDAGRMTMLDPDANGVADALTDGVVTLRYLFGFTGSQIVQDGIGSGAQRTDPAEIFAFLEGFSRRASAASEVGAFRVYETSQAVVDSAVPVDLEPVSEDRQVVTATPQHQTAGAGDQIHVDVSYTTAPLDPTLTGLGLRIHFSSQAFNYDGLTNVLPTNLIARQSPQPDTLDLDHDPATDQYVLVGWSDPFGAAWPGGALPETLYSANFTVAAGYSGVAAINFSASSTAAGFDFASTAAHVAIGQSLPQVNVSDGWTVVEGATTQFDVTLSAHSTQTVTVNYQTVSGSATSGSDFAPQSGQLVFAPGQVHKTVTVPTIDDSTVDGDESFQLRLSNVGSATMGADEASATIIDNEPGESLLKMQVIASDVWGNAVGTLGVGDEFLLQVYVEDRRADPRGVFAAFVDVTYDANLAGLNGPIAYGPGFGNLPTADTSRPGLIDEAGATAGVEPLGGGPFLLWEVPMIALAPGALAIAVSLADLSPDHDSLLVGINSPIPKARIAADQLTLTIRDAINARDDVVPDGNEDELKNVAVLANDEGSEVLTIVSFDAQTLHGATVRQNPDGTLEYDPRIATQLQALRFGQTLEDVFSYTIADSTGARDTATVRVTVHGVNDAPTLASTIPDQATLPLMEIRYSTDSSTFSDVEQDILSYRATGPGGAPLPGWLSFDATTRTLAGTPTVVDTGTVTIVVRATDNGSPPMFAETSFTLTVGNSPYRNPVNRYDVNNDGFVSPIDMLVVINDLIAHGDRRLPIPPGGSVTLAFVDVNGDFHVTPQDVLTVINYLNQPAAKGEGEGSDRARLGAMMLPSDLLPPPTSTGLLTATRMSNDRDVQNFVFDQSDAWWTMDSLDELAADDRIRANSVPVHAHKWDDIDDMFGALDVGDVGPDELQV